MKQENNNNNNNNNIVIIVVVVIKIANLSFCLRWSQQRPPHSAAFLAHQQSETEKLMLKIINTRDQLTNQIHEQVNGLNHF